MGRGLYAKRFCRATPGFLSTSCGREAVTIQHGHMQDHEQTTPWRLLLFQMKSYKKSFIVFREILLELTDMVNFLNHLNVTCSEKLQRQQVPCCVFVVRRTGSDYAEAASKFENKQLLMVALVIFDPLALVFLLVSCDGLVLS